jgi:hypothetical protein
MSTLEKMVEEQFWGEESPKICALHEITSNDRHISIACNFAHYVRFLKMAAIDYDKYFNEIELIDEKLNANGGDLDSLSENESTLINNHEITTEYVVQNVLLRLYLIAERIELVLKTIVYPVNDKENNFKTLIQVSRWANLMKHPRESFFAHSCNVDSSAEKFIIDDSIVQDLWANEGRAKRTTEMLQKQQITIEYPDKTKLLKLIKSLSNELELLTCIIEKNTGYKEILTNRAALEYYFESMDVDT